MNFRILKKSKLHGKFKIVKDYYIECSLNVISIKVMASTLLSLTKIRLLY